MSKRLYLGRLPTDARPEDVQKHFDGYGKTIDCRVMTGFGFVEFETARDAEDVVNAFNGKPFMGQNIIVEFAKDTRRRDERDRPPPPPRVQRRPPGIRLEVAGISRDTSWQDLKDFGREAGNVSFADVDRNGLGILEYLTMEDAENAVRLLDNKDLRGVPVRLTIDDVRDRRSPPRRRSRSPYSSRRDDRDTRRRSRSPPRRYERDDRDYRRDDRRDDRRGGDDRERTRYDDRDSHRDVRRDDREPDRGDVWANGDSRR
ncbi:hypothetical protein FRB98_004476 [Tulasnella sp. 332]|nr:hypothetical protein FRB98_004476 [Tulasnella sp. 332]